MKETTNYYLRKPDRGTRPDRVDIEDLNYNADIIDGELDRLETAKTDREEFEAHRTAAVIDHPNGSVTDAKIGNRTIGSNTGQLTELLNDIANEIKIVKGAGDWEQEPETDLAEAKAHIDNKGNPHGVTKTQVGLANVDDTSDKDKPLSDAAIEAFEAVDDALAEKVNTTDIVQETGANEDKIMSQKAVTDALNSISAGGEDILQSIMAAIYPVGSIYMSANNTNPGELFGGTWEAWGNGKVPVGVDANDADFNSADKTGGTKDVTLTAAQSGTPAHNHGFTGSAVTSGIQSQGHTHAGPSHTHSVTTPNHTHALKKVGSNTNTYSFGWGAYSGLNAGVCMIANGAVVQAQPASAQSGNPILTVSNTAHTTEGSGALTDTCGASGTGATGNVSANHNHTVTAAGTISNNTAANASTAHNNLQPYITCYMWKRTA